MTMTNIEMLNRLDARAKAALEKIIAQNAEAVATTANDIVNCNT